MKGMILITNNFEDVEAIATVDVLRRAGLEVDYVSIDDDLEKHTQSYLPIKCDRIIDSKIINYNQMGFLEKRLKEIELKINSFDEQLFLHTKNLRMLYLLI